MKKRANKVIVLLSVTVAILLGMVIIQYTGLLDQSVFKKTAGETALEAATGETKGPEPQEIQDTTTQAIASNSSAISAETTQPDANNTKPTVTLNEQSNQTNTTTPSKTEQAASTAAATAQPAGKGPVESTTAENPEKAIWSEMHKMSNTKIVAEEIWGRIPIAEKRVSELQDIISKSDYQDKDKLLEILGRWKAGDFSKAVEDHNYLWLQLGGTIGKATGLAVEN